MNANPLVTIGIPTYRRPGLVGGAIESVLGQTWRNVEVIVSDDASPDETPQICIRYAARDARVRYVRQPQNLGPERNFLFLLDQASGKYFFWLSDDDRFEATFLEKAVQLLEADPGIAVCFCDYFATNDQGQVVGEWRLDHLYPGADWRKGRIDFFRHPYSRSCVVGSGLYRTKILRSVGRPLSNTFMHLMAGHEAPLLAQVAARGRIVVLPELLFFSMGHHATKASLAHTMFGGMSGVERLILYATIQCKLVGVALGAPIPWRDRKQLVRETLRATLRKVREAGPRRLFGLGWTTASA